MEISHKDLMLIQRSDAQMIKRQRLGYLGLPLKFP